MLTYFLPLSAGSHKGWATETQDFFCCHGTLVQGNSTWERGILYQEEDQLWIAQYFDFTAQVQVGDVPVTVAMRQDTLTGSFHMSSTSSAVQAVNPTAAAYPHHPDCRVEVVTVQTEAPVEFTLSLRVPSWVKGQAVVLVNGEEVQRLDPSAGFASLRRVWNRGDQVTIQLPLGIHTCSLPEDPNTVAFLYGPVLLAGLCDEERRLEVSGSDPATILVHDGEREWGAWKDTFKTVGQDRGIRFIPLYQVGYEAYTIYFPLKRL